MSVVITHRENTVRNAPMGSTEIQNWVLPTTNVPLAHVQMDRVPVDSSPPPVNKKTQSAGQTTSSVDHARTNQSSSVNVTKGSPVLTVTNVPLATGEIHTKTMEHANRANVTEILIPMTRTRAMPVQENVSSVCTTEPAPTVSNVPTDILNRTENVFHVSVTSSVLILEPMVFATR